MPGPLARTQSYTFRSCIYFHCFHSTYQFSLFSSIHCLGLIGLVHHYGFLIPYYVVFVAIIAIVFMRTSKLFHSYRKSKSIELRIPNYLARLISRAFDRNYRTIFKVVFFSLENRYLSPSSSELFFQSFRRSNATIVFR